MKCDLNRYLYYEFGFDLESEDDTKVSENWPFELEFLGEIKIENETNKVYAFADSKERFFGIDGHVISYFPQGSMDFDNLKRQFLGSKWMSQFELVNLETVVLDDAHVLPTKDRRNYIRDLAKKIFLDRRCHILEGLFLRDTQEYIALVKFKKDNNAYIVGDRIIVRNIPFDDVSPWRRLAVGIGKLVECGKLNISEK